MIVIYGTLLKKGKKMAQNENYVSCAPYPRNHASYDFFYATHVQNDNISRPFFIFSKR